MYGCCGVTPQPVVLSDKSQLLLSSKSGILIWPIESAEQSLAKLSSGSSHKDQTQAWPIKIDTNSAQAHQTPADYFRPKS